MARNEANREDLLAEATALSPRAEWNWNDISVVVGLRPDGAMSIYFDGDPMYQFDPRGCLRRALVDGLLYRTQGDRLAALRRVRSDVETTLCRHDLTPLELLQFLQSMRSLLSQFESSVKQHRAALVRSVPEAVPLQSLLNALECAIQTGQLAASISKRPSPPSLTD
ncbi:MAG: hypothetical protein ACK5Q5_09410 [Planctomycetaceae bacterium]